jgi:hypothetical protein
VGQIKLNGNPLNKVSLNGVEYTTVYVNGTKWLEPVNLAPPTWSGNSRTPFSGWNPKPGLVTSSNLCRQEYGGGSGIWLTATRTSSGVGFYNTTESESKGAYYSTYWMTIYRRGNNAWQFYVSFAGGNAPTNVVVSSTGSWTGTSVMGGAGYETGGGAIRFTWFDPGPWVTLS